MVSSASAFTPESGQEDPWVPPRQHHAPLVLTGMTYQTALTNQPFQTNYPVDEKLVYEEIQKETERKKKITRLLSNPTP